MDAYQALGYRTMVVWECALKGRTRLEFSDVLDILEDWLLNGDSDGEITGS